MNNEKSPYESLRIEGRLGPVEAKEGIEIRPFTVFIGPQGTGKSLLSQLLYFFRDAPYLLHGYWVADGPDASVRRVLEGIRTGDLTNRALASFLTTPSIRIYYECNGGKGSRKVERAISINQNSRKIHPLKPFSEEINGWKLGSSVQPSADFLPQALFVPSERTFFSRFINSDPSMLGNKSLPLTMREFTRVLTEAGQIFLQWQETPSLRPPEVMETEALIQRALRGRVKYSQAGRYAGRWQWIPEGSDQPIDLEMASSGQMEAWPLALAAQAVFGLEKKRRPMFLHIEEPESHLHPAAQVAIVKLLAYLVNHGFRVVATTHSLTVLYTLNNLALAYQKLGDKIAERVPEPEARLNPQHIAAYLFDEGKAIPIRDESGLVDEARLGRVLGDLEVEFNRLSTYGTLWE